MTGDTPKRSTHNDVVGWWTREGRSKVNGLEFCLEMFEIKSAKLSAAELECLAELVRQVLVDGTSIRRFM